MVENRPVLQLFSGKRPPGDVSFDIGIPALSIGRQQILADLSSPKAPARSSIPFWRSSPASSLDLAQIGATGLISSRTFSVFPSLL